MTGKMVRSRAPLRLGLAGGGTDVSPYADTFGGNVINVTIDKYAYASLRPSPDGLTTAKAMDLGITEVREHRVIFDGDQTLKPASSLRLVWGVYDRMMHEFGLDSVALWITTYVDAPLGSGLGSSSALVVALVGAFREYFNLPLGEYELARLAYEIERVDLGLMGGRQDQYAATFGGFNFIEFGANERVLVNPLRIRQNVQNELESSIVLAFTGASRESGRIIEAQTKTVKAGGGALNAMHRIKAEAIDMKSALLTGNIAKMASLLASGWEAKKLTSNSVTMPEVENLFSLAGKLSGAGGGGFAMFFVDPDDRPRLVLALSELMSVQPSTCRFTTEGLTHWRFDQGNML